MESGWIRMAAIVFLYSFKDIFNLLKKPPKNPNPNKNKKEKLYSADVMVLGGWDAVEER